MEIDVRDDRRLVAIWLTNEEKQDAALRESLMALYRSYREQKYLVAVFLSGGHSLTEATSDLLCCNRRRLAQLEARKKQQGTSPEA